MMFASHTIRVRESLDSIAIDQVAIGSILQTTIGLAVSRGLC